MIRIIRTFVSKPLLETLIQNKFKEKYGCLPYEFRSAPVVTLMDKSPKLTSVEDLIEKVKSEIPESEYTTRECLLYLDSVVVEGTLRLVVSDADGSNIRTISPDNCKIDLVD